MTSNPDIADSILDLTLIEPERPFIRIDGEKYEFGLADDYSIIQLREMAKMWEFVLNMDEKKEVTKTQQETYEANIKQLFKYAVPKVPDEIAGQIHRSDKIATIFNFFLEGAKRNPLMKNWNLTSLLQSPAFNNSTVAPSKLPANGSRSPRGTSKRT